MPKKWSNLASFWKFPNLFLFWLFSRVNSKPTNQRSSFCLCFDCNWEFDGIFYNFRFLGRSQSDGNPAKSRRKSEPFGPKTGRHSSRIGQITEQGNSTFYCWHWPRIFETVFWRGHESWNRSWEIRLFIRQFGKNFS